MPRYLARRAQTMLNERALPVNGTRIGLLGVTYKPGIADQRESPAVPLAERACSSSRCRLALLRPIRRGMATLAHQGP